MRPLYLPWPLLFDLDVPVQDDVEVARAFGPAIGAEQQEAAVGANVIGQPGHVRAGTLDHDLRATGTETGAVGRGLQDRGRIKAVAIAIENGLPVFGKYRLLATIQGDGVRAIFAKRADIDLIASGLVRGVGEPATVG